MAHFELFSFRRCCGDNSKYLIRNIYRTAFKFCPDGTYCGKIILTVGPLGMGVAAEFICFGTLLKKSTRMTKNEYAIKYD